MAAVGRCTAYVIIATVLGVAAQVDEYKVIEELINADSYDPLVRPGSLLGKSTRVEAGVYVVDINEFSDVDMDFTMTIYFRQRWVDQRLKSPLLNRSVNMHSRIMSKMWYPDSYFEQEKDAYLHVTTVPNIFIGVSPHDGTVLLSQRLTLKIACMFDLERFPFDEQSCLVNISSYGSSKSDSELVWYDPAIETSPTLRLPEMQLVGTEQGNCTTSFLGSVFSCLTVVLKFERLTGYYFFNTYIPSILIVILSWMSFYIDYASVPARISIGLLTVLTITTQNSGIGARLPRVSYIKAIDVWMSTCLVFVFAALIEYSLVNMVARKQKNKENVKNAVQAFKKIRVNPSSTDGENSAQQNDVRKSRFERFSTRLKTRYGNDHAMIIDVASRVCFPLAFIVFNIVYCLLYLI